jgi:hypothetical protein
MKVKYVGPFDAVELDGVGVVHRNHQIEVTPALAGRPPAARVAAAHAELVEAMAAADHHRSKALREEIIDLDHGEGLLAQPDNWEPVKTSKGSDPQ